MLPRQEIENLKVCPHGGPNYTELEWLGFKPEDMLDFSVSANPFGPPPEVKEAITSSVLDRYPDPESSDLRNALATHLNTNPKNIIVGNGSVEIIRLIAAAFFEKEAPILIVEPTFGEYEIACRISGSKILKHRTQESNSFKLNTDEFASFIQSHRPKAVFLCNPNNPTGQYLNQKEIEQILSASEDTLLILDEAYINFTTEPQSAIQLIDRGNMVIIRSMTKDYALAGLRLGYAIANPEIIDTLKKVCPPWNVNAVAQSAGAIALSKQDYLNRCKDDILKAKGFLLEKLSALGLNPLPSKTHFFLVNVGQANQFRQKLLRHGIMVRDCTSFGLPEYIRIAPRTMPECEKLIQSIGEIQK